jgi:hypothetical protein
MISQSGGSSPSTSPGFTLSAGKPGTGSLNINLGPGGTRVPTSVPSGTNFLQSLSNTDLAIGGMASLALLLAIAG